MLFTVPSTGGCQRKTYSSLVLEILSKNPRNKKTRVFSWIAVVKRINEGRKPGKNSSMRRLEFMLRLKLLFKNSISGGKYAFWTLSVPAKVKTLVWHAFFAQNKIPGENANLLATFNEPPPPSRQPLLALKWKNLFIRTAREYWMIFSWPGFWCRMIRPLPHFSTIHKLDRRHTGRLRKRDNLLDVRGGQGVAKEPNHATGRKTGPL